MEYRIVLDSMEFRALHGCYELERKVGNRFRVDLELTTELGDVAAEDSVEKAVNYLEVYGVVREQMAVTQRTIERVAMNIIEAIYAAFAQVRHPARKMHGGQTGAAARRQAPERPRHPREIDNGGRMPTGTSARFHIKTEPLCITTRTHAPHWAAR